jgi:hypothetical protein
MARRAGCLVLRRVAGAVLPAGPRVLLVLACLLGLATGRASGEVIDRVLAVVSGSLITLSDVNAAYDLGLVVPTTSGDRVREVLSRLIDRELEMAEVARYAPPEPTAAQVDEEVQKVQARFAAPGAFVAVLATSGMDLAHLRETLREDLRIRAYLEQRFTGADEQRARVIAEWVAGLRRRADIVDLLLTDR